jgi:hypothetical protein
MKLMYRPFGLILSVIGGQLAMAAFRRLWSAASGQEDAPKSTDRDRGWREVLVAATLQGAIFGGTKAIIDRFGATAYERLVGVWPGRDSTK